MYTLSLMKTLLLYRDYLFLCTVNFFLGSGDAPSSHHTSTFGLPLAELIAIGLLVGLGLMIALTFLIFNIVWRQNK